MIKVLLSVFGVILFLIPLSSQEEDYIVKLLKRTDTNEIRYLREGKRVSLIDHSGKQFIGTLNIPNDSMIIVGEKEFMVEDVTFLRGSGTSMVFIKSFGVILGAAGLMMTGAGGAVFLDAISRSTTSVYLILIPIGVVMTGIGMVATIKGIKYFLGNENEFDLMRKWYMEIVPISEL